MSEATTLGVVAVIISMLALALSGFTYTSIPNDQVDLTGLESRINTNTANIVGVTSSITTLDNSDRTLSNMIQDLNNDRFSFDRFNDFDDDDIEDLEDDIDDNQDAIDCLEDFADNINITSDDLDDLEDCLDRI